MARLTFWKTALLVIIFDRITKQIVNQFIPQNTGYHTPIISIVNVQNTGTAFGLFKNMAVFFLIFSIAVMSYLILFHKNFKEKFRPALGLILGGAFGNTLDRILYGGVIDFIDIHFWPVFNIADMAITTSIFLIIYLDYYD